MTVESNSVAGPVAVHGGKPECLTEIFRDKVNLAVWRREPRTECLDFARHFASEISSFERFVAQEKDEPVDEVLPRWALELPGARAWLAARTDDDLVEADLLGFLDTMAKEYGYELS